MDIQTKQNFISSAWQDYAMLDSGKGRKLEQFGPIRLIRPEQLATWKPAANPQDWQDADAEFIENERGGGGKWLRQKDFPDRWELAYKDLRFFAEVQASRQVGVFPENAAHWDWTTEQIKKADRPLKVLNLFGYTGLASLAAARAGAQVTHVDSVKRAVSLGQDNQRLSELPETSIRWIVDDVLKFVRREARRGKSYDAIIMDPPKFGLGPKKERWDFAEQFDLLCENLEPILSDTPEFLVVTAYAIQKEPEFLVPYLTALLDPWGGTLAAGELITVEKSAGRRLNLSISARWSARG